MYKRNIIFIIITLFMWITGILGIIFVLTHSTFHYNGLPLWIVYTILAIYCILALIITVITIRRIRKAKNKFRKYYDI